ncbi:hypothetical protein ACFPM0_33690 [Pseudonocardia sulfidoxydans]|uniref:hypothetical protein n=1 Tax=Pseudonocardia sulfidoxydans TaxID=54011 RepID=UPI00361095ED
MTRSSAEVAPRVSSALPCDACNTFACRARQPREPCASGLPASARSSYSPTKAGRAGLMRTCSSAQPHCCGSGLWAAVTLRAGCGAQLHGRRRGKSEQWSCARLHGRSRWSFGPTRRVRARCRTRYGLSGASESDRYGPGAGRQGWTSPCRWPTTPGPSDLLDHEFCR